MEELKNIDEKQRKRYLEYIKNFRLIDDTFMQRVFKDKECTQLLLRIILEKTDLVVITVDVEYDVHNLYGRSVRLDVHAIDSDGVEYDIEIQRSDKGAVVKRARYNSSMLDVDALKASEDFTKLPETYVIFITENDVLKRNLPIYHIDRVIRETGELFDDKAHIVYVNNEIKDDTPLGMLMYDFACTDPKDMHYKELAEKVRYYKDSEQEVVSMCKAMEEIEAKGEARGIAKGEAKKMAEMAERMRRRGMSEEEIRDLVYGETEETVNQP